jgi:preprotein translocase subunit SecA
MTPTQDYRRTHFHRELKVYAGLDAQAHRVARLVRERRCRHLREEALRILEQHARLREITSSELEARLAEARARLRRTAGETVHAALAVLMEAARRHTGLQAHLEQLMGALALARGFLAEMQTGEGKTLVIGLAAALAAWRSPACHVITANDYLATRDAEWLRPFFLMAGLTAGCVTGEMQDAERAANYRQDITYTTAKEAVADFLRDRLRLGALAHGPRRLAQSLLHPGAGAEIVMRGLYSAIIDEADHALIDEAVTPLIISRQQENAPLREACAIAHRLAATLERDADYAADERTHLIALKPAALARLEAASATLPGVWNAAGRRLELITQALVAREFFHRDKQYLVAEEKVVLIDEATGRLMPQRTWRQGLHQAVEAKENIPITAPTETLARLSFQRYFRLYENLAGITGTGREAAAECWHIYHLPFVRIPTHRPCIRRHEPDRVFATGGEKWQAVVEEIERLHRAGRPLLVGTRSVHASEHLARLLREGGLPFALLNAVHHREEASIVAQAGEPGRITIATNMAGRGTDIKLGSGVAESGGLHVLATERHESGRVDRQLFGRAGRQGDPGSAQAFVSLDDDLLRRFGSPWATPIVAPLVARAAPGAHLLAERLISRAQHTAERAASQQRAAILQADTWLDEALAFTAGDGSVAG